MRILMILILGSLVGCGGGESGAFSDNGCTNCYVFDDPLFGDAAVSCSSGGGTLLPDSCFGGLPIRRIHEEDENEVSNDY
jgi:hypothetical protein